MIMRIIVDRSLCDGNGLCVAEAPQHLALDENEELTLLKEGFGIEDADAVRNAIQSCPKAALKTTAEPS